MIKKIFFCVLYIGVLALSVYGSIINVIRFVNDFRAELPWGFLLRDGAFIVVFVVLSVVWLLFCIRRIRRVITDIKINKENK